MSDSLTRRLITAVLLVEVLGSCAFTSIALWHERHSRLRSFDTAIRGRSDSLLGAIQDAEDPEDNVQVDRAEVVLPVGDAYAVYAQNGRLLGASPHAASALVKRSDDGYRVAQDAGQRYRVLQMHGLRIIDREETHGVGLPRPVTIVYAAPLRHLEHELREAAGFYVGVGLLLTVLTAGLLLLLLRRSLQPLNELALAAGIVTPQILTFKAPATAHRLRELQPLTRALSELVARLGQALREEHRFVSDASHELKTAVAVVRSTVQLLALRERTVAEYTAGLERILADNERVEETVARMLELGRLEEGQQASTKPLDLALATREVVGQIGSLLEENEMRVTYVLESDIRVQIARENYSILLMNLLKNAIQHSPKGAEIVLKATSSQLDRGMGVLEVTDFGEGISTESLPHIFDRFYREDRSRSRHTGGTGLGLAICKTIVGGAGGSISARSTKGHGTTVSVALRLVDELPQYTQAPEVSREREIAL